MRSQESNSKPTVSVCSFTYNHESYIAGAIEGVLMQKRDFMLELIIGEDCSTDRTREICLGYMEKFPKIVKVIDREANVGAAKNVEETLQSASGEFIAICEGDDYWTDPLKLQKQVDFLKANPDFSTCFHDVEVLYSDRQKRSHNMVSDGRDEFTFEDMLEKTLSVPTCSLVFRNYREDYTHGLKMLDWVLLLLLAKRGKLKRLDGTMAVYRKHSGGWTNQNWTQNALELMEITRQCKEYFGAEYAKDFERTIARDHADVCFGYFQDGNTAKFLESYKEMSGQMHLLSDRKRRALEFRKALAKTPLIARGYRNFANRYREFMFLRRRGHFDTKEAG